jgi:hypothetical protein
MLFKSKLPRLPIRILASSSPPLPANGLQRQTEPGGTEAADAFGYDGRRFNVSRAIAERVLIPAVKNTAENALIIADGCACRSQIRQFFTGRHQCVWRRRLT